MTLYLVSYDLIGPSRDYARILNHMRSYGVRANPLESVWIVESGLTAEGLRDEVCKHLDANDRVLVVEIGRGWGTRHVDKETTDWMHRNL